MESYQWPIELQISNEVSRSNSNGQWSLPIGNLLYQALCQSPHRSQPIA